MDQNRLLKYSLLIFFLFITSFFHTKEDDKQQVEETNTPIIDMVKRMFSLPTTPPKPSNYLMRVLTYFSHPNLDFRGADKEMAGKEGAKEKVREAVVKSVDKGTSAVQDSAKCVAHFADKAVKKMKRTLSGEREKDL